MDAEPGQDRNKTAGTQRPAVRRRELFSLIFATYKTSFPYFLVIVLALLVLTWLLTEVALVR